MLSFKHDYCISISSYSLRMSKRLIADVSKDQAIMLRFTCSDSFFLLNNGYHWYGELWQLGLFMFIPVLYMYDGKKIKLNIFNKWIFYVFYPLHFIIIGIIKLLIN